MRTTSLVVAMTAMTGCGSVAAPAVPAVHFQMFASPGNDGQEPFDAAWRAARQDPAAGVAYTFPVLTTDVAPGSVVRLLMGRSTNDGGWPLTTADDVIIGDERWLATAMVADDGAAEFAPLGVTTGAWTSDSGAVPAELLCGPTVIAVRAFAPGAGAVPGFRFLASTVMMAVTPACP